MRSAVMRSACESSRKKPVVPGSIVTKVDILSLVFPWTIKEAVRVGIAVMECQLHVCFTS